MFGTRKVRPGCLENLRTPLNLPRLQPGGFSWPKCWPNLAKSLSQRIFKDVLQSAQEDPFSPLQTIVVLEIALQTVDFAIREPHLTLDRLADFIFEQTLTYCVDEPPKSILVLSPEQAREALRFFVLNYHEELREMNFFCTIPSLRELRMPEIGEEEENP